VPDSADVCPACSLTFGDDDGDARKTMLGMSFAAEREGVDDATSTADGAPTAGAPDEDSEEDEETDDSAEELLFNLDFRRSKKPEETSEDGEDEAGGEPLRISDNASPTGTLQGTGSEVTDAEEDGGASDQDDISANPATRTHDGLPEFEPGRVFGGRRTREDVPEGDGETDDAAGENVDEPSRRVEARDLDDVRDAFRRRGEEEAAESERVTEDDEDPVQTDEGPRPEDFSDAPGSGIFKVPGKEKPGHASEQSGSGIIKRPDRSSKSAEEPTSDEQAEDVPQTEGMDEDSDVVGDNTYMEEAGTTDDVPDVRQTAQVAEPDQAASGWSRADETAQIRPDQQQEEPEPQTSQPSLTGETDVISEGGQRGAASWVALVAGLLWVIAADQTWVTGAFEATAIQVKFTAAMLGAFWSLFGPFLVGGRARAYGHVGLGALAGAAFAATLAVTGLALGDIAGLLGAVVLIVAGVLDT
jgi:hypothetical protein